MKKEGNTQQNAINSFFYHEGGGSFYSTHNNIVKITEEKGLLDTNEMRKEVLYNSK